MPGGDFNNFKQVRCENNEHYKADDQRTYPNYSESPVTTSEIGVMERGSKLCHFILYWKSLLRSPFYQSSVGNPSMYFYEKQSTEEKNDRKS